MNMLESFKVNSALLDILPCGLSIATDVSCATIIHNPVAAKFLRIEPFGAFSDSAKEPPPVKIYQKGKLLRPEEMPMQQAAWYGKETRNCTLAFVWPDGISKTARCSASPLRDEEGNITGGMATMEDLTDITELKKNQEKLAESEERYRSIFNNCLDGILLTAPDGTILSANPAACRMFGRTEEELCIVGRFGTFDTEDPRLIEDLQVREITGSATSEMTLLCKDGTKFEWEVTPNLFKDGQGRILSSMILRDITERKQAEEALQLSKQLFFKTFNTNPLLMSISIKNGLFIEINETFVKRLGYTREETIGFTIADLNIWVDIKERAKYIAELEENGFVENFETRFRNKSGELLNVLVAGVSIVWNNESCILTIANDITELRRYQHEMERSDRLNLVGEMAAGFAHEIGNRMTTVRGFLQLFSKQDKYAPDREYLNLMLEEINGANAIIAEFILLARDKAVKKKGQRLNQKIKTVFPLLQAEATEQAMNIQMELGEIPHLVLDRNEITQLILNLARNGLEAMLPGGLLTIKTFKDGDGVVLAVQDQGIGIAPEVLEKIGTPFFTTRAAGTGLGLAKCYSIAQRHNARIDIETGSNGTTFYVRFDTTKDN